MSKFEIHKIPLKIVDVSRVKLLQEQGFKFRHIRLTKAFSKELSQIIYIAKVKMLGRSLFLSEILKIIPVLVIILKVFLRNSSYFFWILYYN